MPLIEGAYHNLPEKTRTSPKPKKEGGEQTPPPNSPDTRRIAVTERCGCGMVLLPVFAPATVTEPEGFRRALRFFLPAFSHRKKYGQEKAARAPVFFSAATRTPARMEPATVEIRNGTTKAV